MKRKKIEVINNLSRGGIFAIHSGFVGSGRGCKRRCYPAAGKDGELISSRFVPGFYLPYDDYRVYKH